MFRGYFAALTATMLLLVTQAAAEPSDVTASGTGFFVNTDGWLITNAHVVEGCTKVSVPSLGEAKDWKIDRQNDIAAARMSGANPVATIAFRRSAPRLGEEVAAFGYPLADVLSDSIKVTTGNINSLTGMESDTRFLQVSTPIQPGNSGGPLVDQSGLIVAVATAQLGASYADATGVLPQNVNFAIRASVVELFLQSREIAVQSNDVMGPILSTADLAEKVAPGVVQVLCHGREPPVAANLHAPVRTPPQPTIVPERVFQSLDNHDAVGFDYQTLKNISRAECQSRCQSDNSCKALTYNKPERFCFLKTGAALLVANRDAATAVAGELAPSVVVSTFTIAASRDMAGGDYLRLRNSNFVACYIACEQDSQCRAFAFVRKQKTCWLKNSIGLLSAKAGVDLGIR